MKKDLQGILKKLNTAEFLELSHAITIAKGAKDFCRNHNISVQEFAFEVGFSRMEAKEYLDGCFPYSLKDIAKVEAFMSLYLEKLEVRKHAENKIRSN